MGWNYRWMRHKPKDQEHYIALHEVVYKKDGKVRTYTKNPITLITSNKKGARWIAKAIVKASKKPLLIYKEDDN